MVEARAKKGNFLKGKQPNFYVGYATLIKSIFSNKLIYQIVCVVTRARSENG